MRVAEVNLEKEYIEHGMEVAVGTNLEELEKHGRDLALVTASPTGKVKIIIPIPGRSLVEVQIPRLSKGLLLKTKELERKQIKFGKTWRKKIAIGFFILSQLFENIAKRIVKTEKGK